MKKHIVIATTIVAMLASSVAMADPHDDRGGDQNQMRNGHRDDDHRDNSYRDNDHHDNGHHRNAHKWKRGQHVDQRYRDDRYVVSDYRRHRLDEPPRGYHWVHDDDNNFLLVAITTGVIASIILGAGR